MRARSASVESPYRTPTWRNLANTDFAAALDNASLKMLITAAAIKIQMMVRLRGARQRVAARKAKAAQTEQEGSQEEGDRQEAEEGAA